MLLVSIGHDDRVIFGALIYTWLNFTPEFQPIVVALCSPLSLAASIYIITGAHAHAYAKNVS